jgi:hypothetical protein
MVQFKHSFIAQGQTRSQVSERHESKMKVKVLERGMEIPSH